MSNLVPKLVVYQLILLVGVVFFLLFIHPVSAQKNKSILIPIGYSLQYLNSNLLMPPNNIKEKTTYRVRHAWIPGEERGL